MRIHLRLLGGILAATLALGACSEQPAPAGEPAAPATSNTATSQDQGMTRAELQRTPAPKGARVYFVNLADGDTVTSPLRIEFGLEGMTVAKAGVNEPATGHHHLLIDTGLPDLSRPIPADANHIHFGDGSKMTEIELAPGSHTLQLVLGDYLHIPHEPPVVSEPITIIVE